MYQNIFLPPKLLDLDLDNTIILSKRLLFQLSYRANMRMYEISVVLYFRIIISSVSYIRVPFQTLLGDVFPSQKLIHLKKHVSLIQTFESVFEVAGLGSG